MQHLRLMPMQRPAEHTNGAGSGVETGQNAPGCSRQGWLIVKAEAGRCTSIRAVLARAAALWLMALLGSLPLAGWAQAPLASGTQRSAAQAGDALSRASAAVVGVRVTAADGARSIPTLGIEREGSGVVIAPGGLVLTIGYLILEAQDVRIITQEGKTLPAVTVAYDLATGFGLVRPLLPWRDASVAPLGNPGGLKSGEPLMAAVGATEDGMDADVSLTQLVSQRPFSGSWEYHIDRALFTSPPVLAGKGNHSGAALFNQQGELVGIGSLRVPDAEGKQRRLVGNMFVPVDLLQPILAELQQTGTSRQSVRPWLGLNSVEQDGRIQVLRVSEDSPAQEAGLRPGDVLLAVDGDRVGSLEGFYKRLWARPTPESPVSLTVQQGGEQRTLQVRPRNRLQTLQKPSGI